MAKLIHMDAKKILFLSGVFILLTVLSGLSALLFIPRQTQIEQADAFSEMAVAETTALVTLVVATPDSFPTMTSAAVETPTSTPAGTQSIHTYPGSFYIKGVPSHKQAYSLGCEAAAAVDWAAYFGVSIMEYTFQVSLPHSDNPDYGFVGDVNSVWGQIPPYAYGVHAGPVADLLVTYGLPAKSVTGYTLDEVRQSLSESKPVIAWVIGRMVWSEATTYVDSEGRSAAVAPYEHVVIVTGYDVNADTIRFMSNGVVYDVPTQTFLTSWGVLGNMAVIYEN
jgi:uncharacterized protein YvpB